MSNNYYEVLELKDKASDVDIIQAYKRLALASHPNNKKTGDLKRFHKIAEAFEVLSDSKLRRHYDNLGMFVFKEGVQQDPSSINKFIAGYSYRGDAFEIFQKFFGQSNPFFSDFSESFSLQKYESVLQDRKQSLTIPDLLVDVPCTLEELYMGCQKLVVFHKSLLQSDGSHVLEAFDKTIEIPAGTEDLSELVFEGEGNEGPNHVKTDLKFIIKQQSHAVFTRQGSDLITTKQIHLVTALSAESMDLVTLDKRVLTVSFDEIISPKTQKVIKNEGMPIKSSAGRGRLIIKFHIDFPKYLQNEAKEALVELLS